MKKTSMLTSRIEFFSLLRIAREKYTLKQLSDILGIDIPTLSKYANYQLMPSVKRARELIPKLLQLVDPIKELQNSLFIKGREFLELNNIVNHRPHLLHYASLMILKDASEEDFDKILTIEGGGLAISSIISLLTGKGIVYGIRGVLHKNAISEQYMPAGIYRYSPKLAGYISIPKNSIARNEKVIIIDDISWSGGTILALHRLAVRSGAIVTGIHLLAIYRDTYDKVRSSISTPIKPIIIID